MSEYKPTVITINRLTKRLAIHMARKSDDGAFEFVCGTPNLTKARHEALVLISQNDDVCPRCRNSFDAYKVTAREKNAVITVMGDCVIVRRHDRTRFYYPARMSGASCRRVLDLFSKCQQGKWANRYHWAS